MRTLQNQFKCLSEKTAIMDISLQEQKEENKDLSEALKSETESVKTWKSKHESLQQ